MNENANANANANEIILAELAEPADAIECDICGATIANVDAAIDDGWAPSYLVDGEETCYPICPKCSCERCQQTDDGPELIRPTLAESIDQEVD